MARGERSRPERTSEERERDRAERERRRAGGSPEAPGGTGRYGSGQLARFGEPTAEQDAAPAPPEPAWSASELAPAGPTPVPEGHTPVPDGPTPAPAEAAVPPSADAAVAPAEESLPADPRPADAAFEAAPTVEPAGYEIPELPPPRPRPQRIARPSLAPPKRSSVLPRRRRGAVATAASAGDEPSGPGSARAPIARMAAVVALLAVVAGVALVARSLKHSSPKPAPGPVVVKVLIPEGETRLQIAQIAARAGLTGDYRKAAQSSPLLDPVKYGAPKGTPDLEGFLFPATYDMDRGAPASRLVEEQLTAFRENFGPEDVSRARVLHITPYELLTVASMVEREAQIPGDRSKIAAVIYNRLKAGMPLGIDATIYYAVEEKDNIPTYTHELTESQLHIDSPYNTRLHTGLPPTPISNPGAASIHAAAHPAAVSYLYYVAGADGCGEQVFSNTQAEFEVNVAAYEAAKKANGGHPPACKKHR